MDRDWGWGSEWAGRARCHDAEDFGRRLRSVLTLAFEDVFVPERKEKG